MFFSLAVLSMLGYVLQSVLLVGFARRIDAGKLVTYRSLSLCITLLPILLVVREGDLLLVWNHAHIFLVAGILGAFYLWCSYRAMCFLPAGSTSAFIAASNTVAVLGYGYALHGEGISPSLQAVVIVIVVSSFVLGFSQKQFAHLDTRIAHGVLLALIAGFPGAMTKILLRVTTQEMHPFVAGYVWEVSIGLSAAVFFMGVHAVKTHTFLTIDRRAFLAILLSSSPTLIGTGAFALALRMGPISIVQAIGAGGWLVLTGIISAGLYREHLTWRQWVPILIIAGCIVALKLLS